MSTRDYPDTNIDVVEEAYRTFWNDEFDAFFDLFHDDFDWIVSEGFPYGGHYRGRQAVMEGVFLPIQNEWDTFQHNLDRLVDGGDTIVAIGEYQCTHDITDEEVKASMVHVFEITNGKIARFRQFTDTALFQAALPAAERTVFD